MQMLSCWQHDNEFYTLKYLRFKSNEIQSEERYTRRIKSNAFNQAFKNTTAPSFWRCNSHAVLQTELLNSKKKMNDTCHGVFISLSFLT